MKINNIKIIVLSCFTLVIAATLFFHNGSERMAMAEGEVAAEFKKNCAMCHSPKAEKLYDPAKPDADHIQVILKGKKTEKPPAMPSYEAKGMTQEQAKALAEYMRKLRTPPPAANAPAPGK